MVADDRYVGESGINSVQNGIILCADVHRLFDTSRNAINTDMGMRDMCIFGGVGSGRDGGGGKRGRKETVVKGV